MAKRGPRALPRAVLKMRGKLGVNYAAGRTQGEQPVELKPAPEPPRKLTGVALATWQRLTPGLIATGVLTDADTEGFALACISYAKALRGDHKELDRWCRHWSRMYGLSPADRTQISVGRKQAGVDVRDREQDKTPPPKTKRA